jgi:uncharacterized protein YegL
MGGTNYSDDLYKDRAATRATKGTPLFAADHYARVGMTGYLTAVSAGIIDDSVDMRKAITNKLHPTLDAKGVLFRESRDSDVHPKSVPISLLLDVTGSMSQVPKLMQEKLPALMGLLIRKGYLEHPAIQIVAFGDATCDHTPLQVGQFESGIEIENDLTNLFLEGGGGGQQTESYELALYFEDRHVVTDHYQKRGMKGYMFIIGDEMPYNKLKIHEVEQVIGDKLTEAISVEQIIQSLREKWEIFYILPNHTNNYHDLMIRNKWEKLLPERVIYLDDPSLINETIAAQIGMFEERFKEDDLKDVGVNDVTTITRAIIPVGDRGSLQTVDSSGAPSGLSEF